MRAAAVASVCEAKDTKSPPAEAMSASEASLYALMTRLRSSSVFPEARKASFIFLETVRVREAAVAVAVVSMAAAGGNMRAAVEERVMRPRLTSISWVSLPESSGRE